MINMKLANKLGLSDSTVAQIRFWQGFRKDLVAAYLREEITSSEYAAKWEQNEYRLQALWGFPLDSKYHKFWEMPGCTCPKMDNDDAYPTGYYTRSGDCPLHGEHTWQK